MKPLPRVCVLGALVAIGLLAAGFLWGGARGSVDWRSVRANIERMHAENPEGGVVIQAR